jgi:ABC-2 type transport system ATP-binding protein
MEEVERIAERVAIIDHGKIIIIGTIDEILKKAGKENLEEAFIALTGAKIREEAVNIGKNQMRISNKLMN